MPRRSPSASLVASFSLAQLVFAPVWGRLSDRIGRKPVLLISLFGTAVGSLLTGVAGVDLASCSWAASSTARPGPACRSPRPRWPTSPRPRTGPGSWACWARRSASASSSARPSARLRRPRRRPVPFFIAAAISAVNAVVAIRRLPETRPSTAGIGAERSPPTVEREAEIERAGSLDGPQPGTPLEAEPDVGAMPAGPAPSTARDPAADHRVVRRHGRLQRLRGHLLAARPTRRFGSEAARAPAPCSRSSASRWWWCRAAIVRPGQRPARRVGHAARRAGRATPSGLAPARVAGRLGAARRRPGLARASVRA